MTKIPRSNTKSMLIDESRMHQVFPKLNEYQISLASRYGERRMMAAGEILYRQGDRHVDFYVVVSGEIEIERRSAIKSHILGVHGAGLFTGEIGTLAGRAAVATCKAIKDSEVIVIKEAALRTLIISEAELSETMMRAFILRRVAFIADEDSGGIILIGSRHSDGILRMREFLSRNGQPTAYFDIDLHEETADLMQRFNISVEDMPAVVTSHGVVLSKPTIRELADAIGLSPDKLDGKHFDLAVVGAGPAGLAAAVYGASEGLNVVVLDGKAAGGQAGTSSKIENYFGFPTGISGQALAGRGLSQARKFGAEVAVPVEAKSLNCDASKDFEIELDNGEKIHAASIVVSTGARYRKPDIPRLEHFEGRGIYYNASFMEANFCTSEKVVVVGGGNSAGQAAVFLASHAKHVHILVRAEGLAASMSHYLIQRIDAASNITLHTRTRIVELLGDGKLQQIRWQHRDDEPELAPVQHVFLFLGAEPNTEWLRDCVARDDKGFVLTGAQIPKQDWQLERPPYSLETSRPGIFAVGDVRSGSVKRVAAAVGEGASAVQSLHQFLAGV
ncbi:FAD-dependent oxidoreductase [Undibacterium terreum]|uniref:Thioredoxin reductase n=1 Tax=Undibacterium terreum TaxID=1224302 RepID=A0A916U3A7_9BURK|nr:FAD-dependent oxidoreductase [Undibacterium terreum]GGC58069.1 thioredoxin reductase [Undibacterium terreum]